MSSRLGRGRRRWKRLRSPRPYKPGYYAAFVLDPDGNNIEAVVDGAPRRSADSVVMEWDD